MAYKCCSFRLNVPLVGEKIFLSHGLKYNLEFLFFKGPWAPFNQWHLKEEFKQVIQTVLRSLRIQKIY